MALSPSSLFSSKPKTPQSLFSVSGDKANQTAKAGGTPYIPNNAAGFGGMNVAPPLGVKATSPTTNISKPTTTLPAAQKAPTKPAVDTNYYMNPGESSDAYTTRIAQYNASKNAPQTGTNAQTTPATNTQTQPSTPPPAAQTTPTFPGLMGQYIQRASQGSPQAQNYTQQTADYGAGNIPVANQAIDIAKQFGQKYADIGKQGAKFEAGQLTTGTSPVAEGNAAVTAQTTAAQQTANAQGEQAALQGIGYQLTGQQQAANAANQAAGQSYTGNAQQLGALNSAVGYAQPQLGSIGQVPFSPTDLSQGAVLGSNVPGGLAGAANMLGGYNAAVQNAQTVGTTNTNISSSGLSQSVDSFNKMNAVNNQFEGQANQLIETLTQGGLNGSLPPANKIINSLGGNLGSPQVTALNSAFAETVAAYTALLSSNGGTPTAQDTQAMSALNVNSTPQQIASSLIQLRAAAKIKLDAAKGLAEGYNSSLNSGASGPTGGATVQTSAGPVNTNW